MPCEGDVRACYLPQPAMIPNDGRILDTLHGDRGMAYLDADAASSSGAVPMGASAEVPEISVSRHLKHGPRDLGAALRASSSARKAFPALLAAGLPEKEAHASIPRQTSKATGGELAPN